MKFCQIASYVVSTMLLANLFSCGNGNDPSASHNQNDSMSATSALSEQPYGTLDGRSVTEYTLTNPAGMRVSLINYGGTITSIVVPDKTGNPGDVVLGFDSLQGYQQEANPFFGCITGRYANRIAKGKFSIDGKSYQLPINNNGNTLHGGINGFNRKFWKAEPIGDSAIRFSYLSPDGEEGFPGNLDVNVTYTLADDNSLRIDYAATTDQPTAVNLTNHSYFNLSAGNDSTVLPHEIYINADKYVAVDNDLIPTGELAAVKGTAMDFNVPTTIGTDLAKVAGGYDHTYVLNKPETGELSLAATLHHPGNGRYMEVFTTEPGIQFYSGNFLDGTLTGKNGKSYVKHGGLCLETQHFPDSPNQPDFPNTILRPGETYRQTTIYKFSVKE